MSAVRLQCVHTTRLLEVFSTTHNTRETYMCRGPMAVGTVLYTPPCRMRGVCVCDVVPERCRSAHKAETSGQNRLVGAVKLQMFRMSPPMHTGHQQAVHGLAGTDAVVEGDYCVWTHG